MTKFRKSLLIFGLLALIIGAALGTFIVLSVIGSIKEEPIELEFTVEDAEQEYNGEALKASSYYLSDGRLVAGHTPVVTFKGEQIDVGTGYSSLDVKIVDERGYDVTDEYSIKVNGGELKVTQYSILIGLKDKEIEYGGTVFSVTEKDYEVIEGKLPQGHRVSLRIKEEWAENINNWKNGSKSLTAKDVDIVFFDNNGRNVSQNYNYALSGSVKLVKRQITLLPLSAEKTYDGRELTCSQYSITKGSLATGQYLEPYFKGVNGETASVKYANEDDPLVVVVDAQIYDNEGNNVTQFYEIEPLRGTLTVHRANLTIIAKSASQEYDGKPFTLSDDDEAESCLGLVAGDSVTVEYSGSVTGIGKAKNEIEKHTVSNDGNGNYNVTYQSGVLEVTKANLTVTLKDREKEYDGKPFFKQGATSAEATYGNVSDFYEITPLPSGFLLTGCELDGILEESELCNTTYNLKGYTVSDSNNNDVSDYFNVTSKPAVCKITRRVVNLKLTGSTLSKVYDGNFTFTSGIGFDKQVLSGHTFKSVTVEPFTPKDGLSKTVDIVSFSLVDSLGRDAIGYYDIQNLNTFKADVMIIPLELSVSTMDYNKEYDGIAVGGDLTYGLLAPTDRIHITEAVSEVNCTGADGKKNEPSFEIYNSKNEVVTAFYKLDKKYGTIKITQKTINVYLEYHERDYTGTALQATALFDKIKCDTISPDNFLLQINTTDTVTVGEKTVTINWKTVEGDGYDEYETFKNNYKVSYGNDKFAIIQKKLECSINAEAAKKYYDAQPLIMSDMTNNLIDTSTLGVEVNLNEFTCTSSSVLGEVNAYRYPATIVYENQSYKITAKGHYEIEKSMVQIVSPKTHEKDYDGKPFTFDVADLVVKIVGTTDPLSSLAVRSYTATSEAIDVNTLSGSNAPKSVEINGAVIVLASTGEAVSANNLVVKQSSIAVTINPTRLRLSINTTNMKQQGEYEPEEFIIANGLGEGNYIVYNDAKVSATSFGVAVYDLYSEDVSTHVKYLNFAIKDKSGKDVTGFYIIDQVEIEVPY